MLYSTSQYAAERKKFVATISGFPIKECRISLLGTNIRIVFVQRSLTENTVLLQDRLVKLLVPWEPGTMTFPSRTEVILESVPEFPVSEIVIISNDIGGGVFDYGRRAIYFGEGTTVWLGCSLELWVRLQTQNATWTEIYPNPNSHGVDYIWQFILGV